MKFYIDKHEEYNEGQKPAFTHHFIDCNKVIELDNFWEIVSRDLMIVLDDNRVYYGDLIDPKNGLKKYNKIQSSEMIERFLPVNPATNQKGYGEVSQIFLLLLLEHLNSGDRYMRKAGKFDKLINDISKLIKKVNAGG